MAALILERAFKDWGLSTVTRMSSHPVLEAQDLLDGLVGLVGVGVGHRLDADGGVASQLDLPYKDGRVLRRGNI
jgi:hypothetical protein